ncbi:Cytosolic iron-sulfur protein assembly protein [Ophidiomyces ophidiicola]|uniref:Cytosolic iron-sulfur protein assembly protein n=1 Tax=Ophidiomyces ophidiicola TaxID=1387563 RepID=UPI0020C541BB|nr:Cytosolic iron-sulfur protein assembly protein [Ophidiomyces ophidiicola]KAI1953681.1 Cytosolic iron-sulfur protein assembly protein [Ophidiomyces ophidiicola]
MDTLPDRLHTTSLAASPSPSSPGPSLQHLADLTPPAQDRTWATAAHPRLPLVATAAADKSVRVYSLVNFALLSTISGGHKRAVRACAWKPTAAKPGSDVVLATASFDATVGVWRYDGEDKDGDGDGDGEEEWGFAVVLDGHENEVKGVAWSAAGQLLATCSRDKTVWIWEDLEDGENNFETVAVLQEHTGDVKSVAWHPDQDCLASGSYDDTLRVWREDVDDWGQVACLRGHEGTVWGVEWEGRTGTPADGDELDIKGVTVPADPAPASSALEPSGTSPTPPFPPALRRRWLHHRARCGPRLASCSADTTVRIWRRQPPASRPAASSLSTIRAASLDETWAQEHQLPAVHALAVHAVAWSRTTGLLASAGADGRVVVYRERFVGMEAEGDEEAVPRTVWEVLARVDEAHGVYEVNHVCWARRADRRSARRKGVFEERTAEEEQQEEEEEEVLLSTGDDGVVKVWRIQW